MLSLLRMSIPRSEVKSRWRTIRDNYMRNNNRNPKKRKRAIYWGMCKFLDAGKAREKNSFDEATMPVSVEMKYEENDSNGIGSENEIGHDLDMIDKEFQDSVYQHPVGLALNLESPSEKEIRDNDTTSTLAQYLAHNDEDKLQFRKFLQDLMKATPQEDEIDVFFKSMAMTVKKFRPDLITKAKVNVFNSVMELEVMNQKTQF
ncbi:uncharacterized protein LOC120352076 isoform X2 [Nilaparvata lugens]|uniref:uncharacterized protein LOC120352076 isoform X2 n=1 Tax=Nilaparvata lugens TaxID=108931 RepID=UPI00193D16FA|nr:uncharacterized protein LOC120352076 isoform X2 [Nilaparvata lugens]